jgi:simple sugar transport system permease protein
MTKKRQLRFTIIRSLVAILIGLLVATVLIFISATGNSLQARLSATQEALKQMLVGPLFRFSKKNGTVFEFKRLADILAAMIPTIFTGLSVCVMFSANQFNLGAEEALKIARLYHCRTAILKERSPSCGCGKVYDGTFSGSLTEGNGVTAELLRREGIEVYGESRVSKLFD